MKIKSKSNRWAAKWIWDKTMIREGERQVIAAKKTIELDTVPENAPSRIFADSLFVLYVNGQELRRGPGRANPSARRYDEVDLAPYLKTGTNVITIVAAINTRQSRNWMPAPLIISDLKGGVIVFEADLGFDELVATDETWLTTAIEGWTLSEPTGMVSQRGIEIIDLGAIPGDLHSETTDEERWTPARVKTGRGMGDRESDRPPSYPYGPLLSTMLSPLHIEDMAFEKYSDDEWRLPTIGSGTLVFDISGNAGDKIEIDMAEIIEDDDTLREFHEPVGIEIIAGSERASVETLDMFGARAVKIIAPDSVTIHSITMRERVYPVAGNSYFKANEPFYEQLFNAGRRTVTLCSCDAYVDNPTREGRAWTGDMVVHQMVDFASNSDWGLARWNPKMGSASTTSYGLVPGAVAGDGEYAQYGIVVDWSLHWVHAVWNICRYNGDVDEVSDLLPEVERVIRWFDQFINPNSGLITDVFGWTLVDWAWVENNGASAALNALVARACDNLADMAEFVGDKGRAERARARHANIKAAFEQFWNPELQRYADTLLDGEFGPNASVHSHAAAAAAKLVPEERFERVAELLSDKSQHVHATLSVIDHDPGMDGSVLTPGAEMLLPELPPAWWDADKKLVKAQPFFRYVVHDALTALGRTDLVFDSLADWQYLLDRCPTSFSETFWGGSIAQGWASTPVRDLITKVAGITPAEPGFKTASINPTLGPLEWIEAAAPTPFGEITVKATKDKVEVNSPVPVIVAGQTLPAGSHEVAL